MYRLENDCAGSDRQASAAIFFWNKRPKIAGFREGLNEFGGVAALYRLILQITPILSWETFANLGYGV